MTEAKHPKRLASKFLGTAVLALSLVGLHGSLWYFRPQLVGETSSLNHNSVVSTYGSSRKLLEFNISVVSGQKVSAMGELDHARKKECSELRHLNSSEVCKFVQSADSCHMDDGFILYIQFPYCSFSGPVALAFVLLALWLVFLFITLGVTADDYFCPSLAVISRTLGVSENIAGVTFLAYGNGAPDIFSAFAAFSNSKNQSGVQLGMQALFGAGMFVTTVVVGFVSFISTVTLTTRPFTRDVLFYLGAVAWTFITLYKENITMVESIGFIVLYVVYILVVIVGHCIYQRWKRKIAATEKYLESHGSTGSKMTDAVGGSNESISAATDNAGSNADNAGSNVSSEGSINGSLNEPATHSLSDALFANENTIFAPAIHHVPKAVLRSISKSTSAERTPLLGGKPKNSGWRKFLHGLEPFDREEWSQSNWFWKFFIICKAPMVFVLNLTIPVVDYGKEDHNWNKWLNVLHCITMPVFGVLATKAYGVSIGGKFPLWALALCGGILLALIVAMTTKNDRPPRAHFLFAYLAFVVSAIWIYSTANEIVNLLKTFGVVSGMSDAILGLTFLAWGNSIGDFVSNSAMARQGFSRMAVSACFGGPLLNMLLSIGISCTYLTISNGHPIQLHHDYNQYVISAGFLAASLSSSAIIIPLMGFKIPRMYGAYLILLYIAYLITSIVAAVKHF